MLIVCPYIVSSFVAVVSVGTRTNCLFCVDGTPRTCSSKGDAIANQQPFCNVDICANYSSPDTDSYFFSDQRRETSWNMPVCVESTVYQSKLYH